MVDTDEVTLHGADWADQVEEADEAEGVVEADGAEAPARGLGTSIPVEESDARLARLFARARGDSEAGNTGGGNTGGGDTGGGDTAGAKAGAGAAPAAPMSATGSASAIAPAPEAPSAARVSEDRSWFGPPPDPPNPPAPPDPPSARPDPPSVRPAPPSVRPAPPSVWPDPPSAPPPVPVVPTGRRRRAWPFVAAGVLVVAGAGGAAYALSRRGGPHPSSALTAAVATTEHAKTAHIALSLTVGSGGPAVTIAGNGATDLASDASNMTLTFSVAGHQLAERAVVDGSTSYYNLGPAVGMVDPGKSWVSMPTGQSAGGSSRIGSGGIFTDPNTVMAVLGAEGTQVSVLGSADVNGVRVQRYAVHLGPAGMRKVTSSMQAPPSMRAEMASAHFSALDYHVAVDGTGHVTQVRAMGAYSFAGQHFTATGTMDLSEYGTPVTVTPPAADQVVSLQQFDRIARQSQGTTSL